MLTVSEVVNSLKARRSWMRLSRLAKTKNTDLIWKEEGLATWQIHDGDEMG